MAENFSPKFLSSVQQIKIVSCSKAGEDGFHSKISGDCLAYHTSCYASYTSAEKIEKHFAYLKKRKSSEQHTSVTTQSSKRLRSRAGIHCTNLSAFHNMFSHKNEVFS